MSNKIIQVPIDENLLDSLDKTSKKQRKARAELIREACRSYLGQIEADELEKAYQTGYKKFPEDPELGESQATMAGEILPRESW